jgi:hypothetical protein
MIFSLIRGESQMADLSGIINQLTTERDRLNDAIATLQNINGDSRRVSGKRTVSAASRAKMARALRARWAKVKAKKKA